MFKEIKERLKAYAVEIREFKNKRKLQNRGQLHLSDIELHINKLKYHYRHTHIALCEIRGRKREEIERPSKFNTPNESYITKIKEEILQKIHDEQIIRSSETGS